MADRPQSIAHSRRESWEDQPAFRENFLSFVQPDRRDAFRQLGDFFFTVLLDSPFVYHERAEQLQGLAADVAATAATLDALAHDLGDEALFPTLLTRWAARLSAIHDEMHDALEGAEG